MQHDVLREMPGWGACERFVHAPSGREIPRAPTREEVCDAIAVLAGTWFTRPDLFATMCAFPLRYALRITVHTLADEGYSESAVGYALAILFDAGAHNLDWRDVPPMRLPKGYVVSAEDDADLLRVTDWSHHE